MEHRPLGVGAGRRAAARAGVRGGDEHRAARLGDGRRGGVRVVTGHVGSPPRALGVARGCDGGRVVPVERSDEVGAGGVGGHDVGQLPAEEPAVELRGGREVGLGHVDPGRHPLGVAALVGEDDLVVLAAHTPIVADRTDTPAG